MVCRWHRDGQIQEPSNAKSWLRSTRIPHPFLRASAELLAARGVLATPGRIVGRTLLREEEGGVAPPEESAGAERSGGSAKLRAVVAVPVRNEERHLPACLDALIAQRSRTGRRPGPSGLYC